MALPAGFDDLWAKSAALGQLRGETIAVHTRYVLHVLADLYRLRPDLAQTLDCPRFWHRAYWSCFLHDLGKAASGFQGQVRVNGSKWGKRHEVLSLAFVDWLADLEESDYIWLIAAIASHHKDAGRIAELYPTNLDIDDDATTEMVSDISEPDLGVLWDFIAAFGNLWRDELGFTGAGVQYLHVQDKVSAVAGFRRDGREHILKALRSYRQYVRKLRDGQFDPATVRLAIALRGTVVGADHLGSAHVLRPTHMPVRDVDDTLTRLKMSRDDLYDHQREAGHRTGSVILRAPTGSGKTEAALLWASKQMEISKHPRLFYVLPFQASMNAMLDRLKRTFGDCIGLQHGHSLHALYQRLLDQEPTPADAERAARRANNLAQLHHQPLRILSPYQLLKACYRLRGYEAILTDLYNGLFILDEIHAYESERLALITKMIEYLARYYGTHFFVMSATLPSLIQKRLATAIGVTGDIVASTSLFESFQRHVAYVLPGDLLDGPNMERIVADAIAGKSVLVCCNTVARAQQAYNILHQRLAPAGTTIDLLHGGFNARDRGSKESRLMERVDANRPGQQRTVLVATQVVEVSLDIDFDTLYSDPAPLDALLQRFGRVNRRGRKGLCSVHVFRLPDDGQHIYDKRMVKGAIEALETADASGRPIDEANVRGWLDAIYQGEIADDWNNAFDKASREFEAACLDTLYPFQSDETLEQLFYEAFDAIDVLPVSLEDEYKSLAEDEPLAAGSLLVSIRYGRFHGLKRAGKVLERKERWPTVVDVPYDNRFGLQVGGGSE